MEGTKKEGAGREKGALERKEAGYLHIKILRNQKVF
jgi:hypothetical protein